MEAIKKMLESENDCEKVAVQFKASHSALWWVFRDYLHHNALKCDSKNSEMLKKILDMIVK